MSSLKLTFSSAEPLSHLRELQDRIRKEPQRPELRIFLFQLYCLQGEWVKAANQLSALEELDKESLSLVQTYREAVRCEVLRRDVFAGGKTPLILGDPTDWIAWMLEALKLDAAGRHDEAGPSRERALDAAPASAGRIDGKPFSWLADGDSRLGPILEAVVNGKYYWVPLYRLTRLEIEAPVDLRDLVWMPATLGFANGGSSVALIPTRYPGSEASTDERIRLARMTEWNELAPGTWAGSGQRMLVTDEGEFPLMEIREVTFSTTDG